MKTTEIQNLTKNNFRYKSNPIKFGANPDDIVVSKNITMAKQNSRQIYYYNKEAGFL